MARKVFKLYWLDGRPLEEVKKELEQKILDDWNRAGTEITIKSFERTKEDHNE